MGARSNRRQVSNAGTRPLGKSVAVCTEESWLDLLRPERERLADLQAAHDGTPLMDDETEGLLLALGQAVEQRDHNLAGHCERLAFIGVAMGVVMRPGTHQPAGALPCGYLHDVGKVGIPDSILFKPGALTAPEWVIMRTHPGAGRRDLPPPEIAPPGAAHHPASP